MEVIFRPNENLCLLAALWGVANGEQQELMTNGGEANLKELFKNRMGKEKDDISKNGAGTDDVKNSLKGVVKANEARGIKVGFKWRKIIPLALFAFTTPLRDFLTSSVPAPFFRISSFSFPVLFLNNSFRFASPPFVSFHC